MVERGGIMSGEGRIKCPGFHCKETEMVRIGGNCPISGERINKIVSPGTALLLFSQYLNRLGGAGSSLPSKEEG